MSQNPAAAPLDIAFVLPSFAGGGAERVMLTLAAGLDRSVFAPRLIVLSAIGPWRSLVPPDIPITDLGRRRLRHALPALRRALASLSPALVVSTMGYLNLGLLLLRPMLPPMGMILREANLPGRANPSLLFGVAERTAYGLLYRWSDAVLAPATAIAEALAGGYGVPRALIRNLPNPVDEAALRAEAMPPRRAPGPGPRLIAIGRLTRQKGFDRLLDAFAAARADSHLTILGEGEDRPALEAQRRALGLDGRIALPGFEARPAPYLAGADALVLPSRWEGLPNAALEALACGTRVIATPEAGGILDIAARAAAGAVEIVAAADLPKALSRTAASPVAVPRPSLLPAEYRIDTACRRFAALLTEIAQRRGANSAGR